MMCYCGFCKTTAEDCFFLDIWLNALLTLCKICNWIIHCALRIKWSHTVLVNILSEYLEFVNNHFIATKQGVSFTAHIYMREQCTCTIVCTLNSKNIHPLITFQMIDKPNALVVMQIFSVPPFIAVCIINHLHNVLHLTPLGVSWAVLWHGSLSRIHKTTIIISGYLMNCSSKYLFFRNCQLAGKIYETASQ